MRSSLGTLGSCDNSKLNFDLKITCCHRQKPEKKTKKKKASGKGVLDEILRSSSKLTQDENITNFEIYGTPVCFEQCRNSSPFKTRIYSNFHSFCVKKENGNNNTSRLEKSKSTKLNKSRDSNYHRNSDQERFSSSYRDKPKKLLNRKPFNPIVIPRVPLEIKTSVFPHSRTNFHNLKEPPLFSSTEEARRAIVHVLNCADEKFLQSRVRPFVSGNLMNRYIQDVYDYLYKRHVETLNNVCTIELPPHRRSIHIHNKDYLYEDDLGQQEKTVDTVKYESSEEDSGDSEEEELDEDFEHVNIDQPLVRVSPLPPT